VTALRVLARSDRAPSVEPVESLAHVDRIDAEIDPVAGPRPNILLVPCDADQAGQVCVAELSSLFRSAAVAQHQNERVGGLTTGGLSFITP